MQLVERGMSMSNFSGNFVSDLVRCFNNTKNYLVFEFDHGEVLQIYLGEGKNFNTGEVLKIDNAKNELNINFGTQCLFKKSSPFKIENRYPTRNEEPGFYLGDINRKSLDKLEDTHIHQLLSLKICVEEGDFFMEIYDAATPNIRVIQPAK